MAEFTTGRKRTLPSKFDDYILEGKEGEFVANLKRNIENKHSCDKAEIDTVMNELANEFQKLESKDDATLIDELKNLSINGGGKKMKGGFTGVSSYALILYLVADAMKQSVEKTKDIAMDVLQKGVQLLELLSNKDGCAEQFLYELFGKKMMDFFKFYLIGVLSTEAVKSNPLVLLKQLTTLLPLIAKYGTKGIGMTIVTSVGYLIYHFVNHYKDKLTGGVNEKLKELNNILTSIHEANSEDVVEKVESKVGELKTAAENLHNELTRNMTKEEQQNFMKKISENLTEEQRFLEEAQNSVREFENVMTIEELHNKLMNDELENTGGKKKKNRSTQKKKKGTKSKKNKKAKRKTNKKSSKG